MWVAFSNGLEAQKGWKRERRKLAENQYSLCFMNPWDKSKQPHTSVSVPSSMWLTVRLRLSARATHSCFKLLHRVWAVTVSTRVGMSSGQEPVFKHVSETFEDEKKRKSADILAIYPWVTANCVSALHCLPGVQVKLCGQCPWVVLACGTLAFNSMPLSQWRRSAFSHPVCSHIISKCRTSRHSSLYLPWFLCSELGIYWSISPYPQRRRLRFHF